MILVMPDFQAFHPEFQLNEKSRLHIFLGFAWVLRNHIIWFNHLTIHPFILSNPSSGLT